MGRQEQPLDPHQGPLARFAYDLRELRRRAGSPSYRQLAGRTHYSASTLAAAADGRRLPSAAVLAAFVTACGGDPDAWEQRRIHAHHLSTSLPPADDPAGDPAGDPTPDPAPATAATVTVAAAVGSPAPSTAAPVPQAVPAPAPAPAPEPAPAAALAPAEPAARRRWHRFTATGPARRTGRPALRRLVGLLAAAAAVVAFGAFVPGDTMAPVGLQDDARWLRPDAGIPQRYRHLIVQAGTMCDFPGITPALIAAMLQAESGFDPTLSDPDNDEYGIARWTPRVLRHYLPPDRQGSMPTPPFSPEDSIPAVGRMLCAIAPELEGVPGDPAVNLAAAYRTATWIVQRQDPALQRIRPYLDQVRANLLNYRPAADHPTGRQ
ncbi:helix-turn-helix domain-containing protein [Kitasatospora sp. NPDC127111]|uniref:helix-turn-helix domain-containing protein n=1 Tax=Kitasatospora sp. NPDC127111 TaxID=3345363 RepID=UPI00362F82E9